jgi:hypothetical protein
MKENQKDTLTTGSQSQQAQNSQYNPTKVGTPSPKHDTRDEEEEEEQPQAGTKPYESKEQRDGKPSQQQTPNHRDEDQRRTQSPLTEQNKTQNGSQQTAEQKKR